MDEKNRNKLESAGWRLGSASDFLGLSPEEAACVELKLALGSELEAGFPLRRLRRLALRELDPQRRVGPAALGGASGRVRKPVTSSGIGPAAPMKREA